MIGCLDFNLGTCWMHDRDSNDGLETDWLWNYMPIERMIESFGCEINALEVHALEMRFKWMIRHDEMDKLCCTE